MLGDRPEEFICARCGHSSRLHGRRGHGACRHGWAKPLEIAVATVRACVIAGVSDDERKKLVDETMSAPYAPCTCKRLRRTPLANEDEAT